MSFSSLRGRLSGASKKVRLVSAWSALAVSLCVAVAVFGMTLNFSMLNPTHIRWCMSTDYSDTSVYFFSFAYYRQAPWSFPITGISNLFYPAGTSLAVMDGLPLLAVPLKVISRFLPDRFQFLGPWLFICMWLQTFCAERLLRILKLPAAYCWAGALFAVIAPPFIDRFGHVALSSHWVLLLAMIAACTEVPGILLWLAPIIALWIHPYLFAMVSALSVAGQLRFARAPGALLRMLATVVGLGVSLWVLGYLQMSETKSGRFEYYAADLTTFVNSMGDSRWLPGRALVGGSWEGSAYLGMGGFVLCGALLITLSVPRLRRASGQNWWLLGMSVALGLYSLSSAIHFLGVPVFRSDLLARLVAPLASRFRTAGRFIWPLYYYQLFLGMKALHQLAGERRLWRWSAPALFALQLCELWPHLNDKSAHPELNVAINAPPVPEEISAQLTPNTRFLIFMPPVRASCANKVWHGPYQNLAWFGALHGLITNANLGEARHSPEDTLAVCRFTIEMYRHREAHPEAIFIRR